MSLLPYLLMATLGALSVAAQLAVLALLTGGAP